MTASLDHESLVSLFHRQPLLAAELLAPFPGLAPHATSAELLSADLGAPIPVERRADAVIRVYTDGEPLVLIGEVQLQPDPEKPWVWPHYVASARDRLRCRVLLLVLTLDEATARWARRPIPLGNPGSTWAPIVVGPAQIPMITTSAAALAHPEMAVLSAIIHGQGAEAHAVGLAAMGAALSLDDDRAALYSDIILWALPEHAREILEALMTQPYEYKSEYARKYYGKAPEVFREEGREEGRESEARRILQRLLQRRFGPLPDGVAPRLEAADLTQLESWADAIFDVPSLDALFASSR